MYNLETIQIEQYNKKYYFPTVETKNYFFRIAGENFLDQPVKNDLRTYDNIQKLVTSQGDD